MANGHGGKRPGSGRKRSPAREKTREVADAVILQGTTPLEVMIEAMNHYQKAGNLDRAAAIAKDAAPYMHPRLSYVKSDVTLSDVDADEALETELEGLLAGRKAACPDEAQTPPESTNGHASQGNGSGPVAGGPAPLF